MKRKIAWLGVILSSLYLLTIGLIPDPIPLIDEGIALAVLLKCASVLGFDLRNWLPFPAHGGKSNAKHRQKKTRDITIDV